MSNTTFVNDTMLSLISLNPVKLNPKIQFAINLITFLLKSSLTCFSYDTCCSKATNSFLTSLSLSKSISSESIMWIFYTIDFSKGFEFYGHKLKTRESIDSRAILFRDWSKIKFSLKIKFKSCFSSIEIALFKLKSDHTHFSLSASLMLETFLKSDLQLSSKLYAILTHSTSWCEYLSKSWMWLL